MKKNLDKFKLLIKTIYFSLGIMIKARPQAVPFYIFTILVQSIFPSVNIYLLKILVDTTIANLQKGNNNYDDSLKILLVMLILQIILLIGTVIDRFLQSSAWDLLTRYVQLSIFKQCRSLDISFFEDSEFYNKFEKARGSIETVVPRMFYSSIDIVRGTLKMIGYLILLSQISWVLIPIIIAINLPSLMLGLSWGFKRYGMYSSRIPEARRAGYASAIISKSASAKEVKLFNLGDYLERIFNTYYDKVVEENLKHDRKQFGGAFIVNLLIEIVRLGFSAYIVLQVFANKLTIGDISLYIQAFGQANGVMGDIYRSATDIFVDGNYINDYVEFLNLKPTIIESKDAVKLTEIKKVEFKNVSFKYPNASKFALEDISFEINENENIALVGTNGSGKTTIVKLLARFYDVTSGEILINGRNIKDYTFESLWSQIGIIFQDFIKYDLTVKENIGFGQIDLIENKDEIKTAAQKASASDFIEEFNDQYEQMLGKQFENGVELSGGQWQRIALARAFLRKSSLIILDEPTASLDAEAEYEIFKKFVELVENKIAILISHRFSTVRLADKIIVIHDSKLIEMGSHRELIDMNGEYAKLFNLQAEGYK